MAVWCMLPGVQDLMEGCPEDERLNMLYLVLSGLLTTFCFLVIKIGFNIRKKFKRAKLESKRASMVDAQYLNLQSELYGPDKMNRSNHSRRSNSSSKKGDDTMATTRTTATSRVSSNRSVSETA